LHDIIGVNQDVVQVDYYAHIQEVREHVVHEVLKGSWYKETPPFLPLNNMTMLWSYFSLFN